MSQRTVWACDLCGKDVAKEDVRTFHGGPSISNIYPTRDIGPCCYQQPIERLVLSFAIKKDLP